jgi:hypothetical protein
MPETHRLYLDQMLRLEVAQALRDDGHDVLRSAHRIDQSGLIRHNSPIDLFLNQVP